MVQFLNWINFIFKLVQYFLNWFIFFQTSLIFLNWFRGEGTVKGKKRIGTLGRKISRKFFVLFFSSPQKYHAPIFHHTPKYESPFQTVDK